MWNTVGNNPDAVQLGFVDNSSGLGDLVLTLRLREIGAQLSCDGHVATLPARAAPEEPIALPE